jgi:predicted DCC family thiol-disulfide oxidoreductase YuxK
MSKEVDTYSHPIIFFDGVCNFCNSIINFIIRHDKKNIFYFSPLQSEFCKKTLQQFPVPFEGLDTVILLYQDATFQRSEAFFEIVKMLRFPWSILRYFRIIPGKLRDIIYFNISRNRYSWFGKSESCMIPGDNIKNRFL